MTKEEKLTDLRGSSSPSSLDPGVRQAAEPAPLLYNDCLIATALAGGWRVRAGAPKASRGEMGRKMLRVQPGFPGW